MAEFKAVCSTEFAYVIDLAAHTGLRRGDLIRLAWSHIGDDAIALTTGKSGHRRDAIIPLYDGLRAVLAGIPKVSPTVLTNSWGKPWKADAIGNAVKRAKAAAGWADKDLHFHDLRGTAATKFYLANLRPREIAEIMGWQEETVERIIRRYVGRTAATRALIERLNRNAR